MATYLEMAFRNQASYLVIISVLDPRPDITGGEVEAVMDTIIAQNILTSPGGVDYEDARRLIEGGEH
ncbi:hypothetical protein JOC37_002263 [Desulfohalotomaculum tongense]|uniref:DUF2922 domain-containing protein n=1 Tax=Desulforadius tongensis TaxID=1216062 RepID=UPI00195660E0|nr:DUF2922 domain-containing protein [Desulforadius tongensis]MBM7855842.1 hypothetical protein [Desulforadius tongensis]